LGVIRIYSGKSTPAELLTNGIGALEATLCNPREELNGEFSCDISIPVNSAHSDAFVFGAIIKCSTPRGMDLFRLDPPTVTLTDMTAKAWQISNDLGCPKVLNIYMSAKTGQQALTQILTASADEQRFSGTSDITTINNMRLDMVSPQAGVMNTESPCFLNLWGGELLRNKFGVDILSRIGSDKGYKIALGKNLLGVSESPSGTGYTNRIIPKCNYGAMRSDELNAYKAATDEAKDANIQAARDKKTAIYADLKAVYDAAALTAAAIRDAEYARIEADYLIDDNYTRKTDRRSVASDVYDAAVDAARAIRTSGEDAADAELTRAIDQATNYANELKALADKRFSDLSDARKADVFLPELYIDSPIINPYDTLIHTKFVDCVNIKVDEKNTDTGLIAYPTKEDSFVAMRGYVASLYALGADVPGATIDISFVDLKNTEEYKQFLALNTLDLQLGDTVHCKHFNRDISKRVSAYVWNSLSDRYESITIGDIAPNIAKSMYAQDVSLEALRNDMTGTIKQGEKYNNVYINHTDGFVAECAALNSKAVMNGEKMGYYDMTNDAFLGGLTNVGGVIGLVAGMLTNSASSPSCWSTIGEITISGKVYKGIFMYLAAYSSTIPIVKIVSNYATAYDTRMLRIYMPDGSYIGLTESNDGTRTFQSSFSNSAWFTDLNFTTWASGFYASFSGGSQTNSNLENGFGFSETGPYYTKNGVQHDLL
jgi:phage minor structural protein